MYRCVREMFYRYCIVLFQNEAVNQTTELSLKRTFINASEKCSVLLLTHMQIPLRRKILNIIVRT